jgi:hypothetical protein
MTIGVLFIVLQLSTVFIIAVCFVTIHVCDKLIACKYMAIDKMCKSVHEKKSREGQDPKEIEESVTILRELLASNITPTYIGRIAHGRALGWAFEIAMVIAQFGIAVNYHILFGNSLYNLIFNERVLSSDAGHIDHEAMGNRTVSELDSASSSGAILVGLVVSPLPVYIAYCFFRDFRHFSVVSFITTAAIIFALCMTSIYTMIGDINRVDYYPKISQFPSAQNSALVIQNHLYSRRRLWGLSKCCLRLKSSLL